MYMHVVFRIDNEMGIRGLTSFIDDHPELLTDFHLHDTRIVIDGNNLYHFLYYYFHIPCEYGGDYDQFARNCDAFFGVLDSCNITPYVVFDGAYAADGNKFDMSLARARERVHMSNIVAHGRRAKILPILTHSCFVHVLCRLGVEYVTCDFEADHQIAALARHWNCPVLTNDSDFFVYDIPAGVILLDYLNLRSKVLHGNPKPHSTVRHRYLEAQMFYCQKFMKFLHIDNHSLVVLFATLLGNDIVDGRNFENFFSHIKLPKTHNHSKSSHRHRKIAGLTAWLQSVSTASDAIEYILTKLPQNRRKIVGSLIELSLDCYCDPQSTLNEYFEVDDEQKKYTVRTFGECILPDWFLVSVCHGSIQTAMLNVLASRRLLLLSQIEASPEVSSYRCSHKLRQIAYGIALSVNNSPADWNNSHDFCVNEFDRECKALKMCSVEPTSQLNGKPLPCLTEVSHIDRRERFLLLLESLETSVDCVFDLMIPDVQFLVAVIRYWIHHASAKLSELHIHAVLLCSLKLGALDPYFLIAPQSKTVTEAVCHSVWLLQMKKSQVHILSDLTVADDCNDSNVFSTTLKALAQGLDICTDRRSDVAVVEETHKCQLDKVKEKLFRFDSAPHHNRAVTYNAATVYAFAEFQTTLMSAACIANVLGLTVHDPASVFSGTVLYNLVRELHSRSNPNMYVTELLGGSSSVLPSCYFQLMSVILMGVPEGRLEVTGCRPKKKGKRGKKISCKGESDEPQSLLQDVQIVDGNEEQYVLNCDVDNRFSGLSFTE